MSVFWIMIKAKNEFPMHKDSRNGLKVVEVLLGKTKMIYDEAIILGKVRVVSIAIYCS